MRMLHSKPADLSAFRKTCNSLHYSSWKNKSRLLLCVLISTALLGFSVPRSLADSSKPIVFKIQFEWGATSQEGYTYKGTAVGQFSPSSRWTGHIGINMKAVTGKGLNESSPASLYQGLGSVSAMRPGDKLQFYMAVYSAKVETDNGCSFTDEQTENPETYTASIERDENGAVLEFGSLEAGDPEAKCDHFDVAFSKDFAPGQDKILEEFFTFRLTNEDLAKFKTIRKVNTCNLDAVNPTPGKIWGKATLTAE